MTHSARHSRLLLFLLGLLGMLTPLAIDMYLPSLPTISRELASPVGLVQMTLSVYTFGFAAGQLLHGPLADSLGRRRVLLAGITLFAVISVFCALAQNIEQLIVLRLLQGFAGAAAGVVINALLRDLYEGAQFVRMMSFVTLVTTMAPLVAPFLGGYMLIWFDWRAIFWVLAALAIITAVLVFRLIPETLRDDMRQPLHLGSSLRHYADLFTRRETVGYMLCMGFSFAGMFAFLTAGAFVYIELNHVRPEHFGFYFALNIITMMALTTLNSRRVKVQGVDRQLRFGLFIQLFAALVLLASQIFHGGLIPLVAGVALFVGCISTVGSNAMAIILDRNAERAGTASSLAGTLRFGIGSLAGALIAILPSHSAWSMVGVMAASAVMCLVSYFWARSGK